MSQNASPHDPSPDFEGFRLSPQQARQWRAQGKGHDGWVEGRFTIEGPLDRELLVGALGDLVASHEILRTTFRAMPGLDLPLQVISDPAAPPDLDEAWGDTQTGGPTTPPRLRARLESLAEDRHRLDLALPALWADAQSLVVLARQLATALDARHRGHILELEVLQMADVAEFLNEQIESEDEERDAFWHAQELVEHPPLLAPFVGDPQSEEGSGRATRSVDPSLAEELARLETDHGLAPDDVLLAAWIVLLARHGEVECGRLGVVFDGRHLEELDDAVGPLSRPLPFPFTLDPAERFATFCRALAGRREELAPWQSTCETSRFVDDPVGFAFDRLGAPSRAGAFTVEPVAVRRAGDGFALQLLATQLGPQTGDGLRLELVFDPRRARPEAVETLADQFLVVLAHAVEGLRTPLGQLEWIGASEGRALADGLATADDFPPWEGPETIPALFSRAASHGPERPALVFEEQTLDYATLEQRAHRLAHHLLDLGLRAEDRVAISLDRSAEMIVALLGILQAGGAYVALEPGLPALRRGAILRQSGARWLVSDGEGAVPEGVTRIDPGADALDTYPTTAPGIAIDPDQLAYVLFTSGSTGEPKGVAVSHCQIVDYARGIDRRLGLGRGASWATVSTLAADLGNTAIFGAWVGGGTLHVIAQHRLADPNALAELAERRPVDCLKIVPSHLEALLTHDAPARLLPRRALVLGGEVFPWSLAERLRALAPELMIVNHYGPTETTVGVAGHRLGSTPAERAARTVPFGLPLANQRLNAVDRTGRRVPTGAVGELWIGGHGVTRGYLGHPAATAERFVPDPFASGKGGGRLYRSGDRVRLQTGCGFEFVGRGDFQVKIRGFRVEPGEVEAALREHPAVTQGVVKTIDDPAEGPSLAAYVVGDVTPQQLRDHLLQRLPEVLVPSAFVRLETLPLNRNGKVDRDALPAPDTVRQRPPFVAPRNATEETLAALWQELLGETAIGVHDDFFDLGGHSLLVARLVAHIRRQLGVEISPDRVFLAPTLAELALTVVEVAAVGAAEGDKAADETADDTLESLLAELEGMDEDDAVALLAHDGGGSEDAR